MGGETTVQFLKSGISIQSLYSDLSEEKIEQIKSASKDGFSEDELQRLESDGIDISLLRENFDSKENKTTSDVNEKAKSIKEKYCSDLESYNGDVYSISNPELKAFKQALNDNLLNELSKEGFNKTQIIEIISQSFPSIGIKNGDDGQYECPKGHDSESSEIYVDFVNALLEATGGESSEISSARQELNNLNLQIETNNNELKTKQKEIQQLQKEIEELMNNAIEESEEIAKNQKESAKSAVNKRLDEYIQSNGTMSYEEFQNNLANDLDSLEGISNSKLSNIVLDMLDAQNKMSTVKIYLKDINSLMKDNETLTNKAQDAKENLDNLLDKQKEEGISADDDAKETDPIGFLHKNTRYDFFVDKDNNDDLSNENEFLGAKNGFLELINLDKNKDNKVDAKELIQNDIKVVVTKNNGSQTVKNASDIFDEGDFIDLSSYTKKDTTLENGNKLLGVFDVKFDDEMLDDKGYQTLDKIEWLDKNYNFSDNKSEKNSSIIAEATDFTNQYNIFLNRNNRLDDKLNSAQRKIESISKSINENITKNAINNSKSKTEPNEIDTSEQKLLEEEEKKNKE